MLNAVDSDAATRCEYDGDYEDDAVTWLPDGRGFLILDSHQFGTATLPRYFHTIQYKSFVRQLNIYGFHRVTAKGSPDYGAYTHPLFVRGRPDLCLAMKRQKVKGTGVTRRKAAEA
jgi:hypothetical protein